MHRAADGDESAAKDLLRGEWWTGDSDNALDVAKVQKIARDRLSRVQERTGPDGTVWEYHQAYLPYDGPNSVYGWFTDRMTCKCHDMYAADHLAEVAR